MTSPFGMRPKRSKISSLGDCIELGIKKNSPLAKRLAICYVCFSRCRENSSRYEDFCAECDNFIEVYRNATGNNVRIDRIGNVTFITDDGSYTASLEFLYALLAG